MMLNPTLPNLPYSVQLMAWRRICDMPSFEPKISQFGDVYMRHSPSAKEIDMKNLFAIIEPCDLDIAYDKSHAIDCDVWENTVI